MTMIPRTEPRMEAARRVDLELEDVDLMRGGEELSQDLKKKSQ